MLSTDSLTSLAEMRPLPSMSRYRKASAACCGGRKSSRSAGLGERKGQHPSIQGSSNGARGRCRATGQRKSVLEEWHAHGTHTAKRVDAQGEVDGGRGSRKRGQAWRRAAGRRRPEGAESTSNA
jgi:hypothetical protein